MGDLHLKVSLHAILNWTEQRMDDSIENVQFVAFLFFLLSRKNKYFFIRNSSYNQRSIDPWYTDIILYFFRDYFKGFLNQDSRKKHLVLFLFSFSKHIFIVLTSHAKLQWTIYSAHLLYTSMYHILNIFE